MGWGVRTAVLAAIQFNVTRRLCSVLGGISKTPAPACKKPIVSTEDYGREEGTQRTITLLHELKTTRGTEE